MELRRGSVSSSKKSYTVTFKLEVIRFAEANSKLRAAKFFNVSRSRVQQWVSQKGELLLSNPADRRLKGAGRPVVNDHVDKLVFEFVKEHLSQQLRVTRSMIRSYAKSIGPENFHASCGWLEKFMRRHNLTNRHATSVCHKKQEDYESALIEFILHVAQVARQHDHRHFFAAGETVVSFSGLNGCAVSENKATEPPPVPSPEHGNTRLTVMLTAGSDGSKYKPFVLVDRKHSDSKKARDFERDIELCWAGTTRMDDETTSLYLSKIFGASPEDRLLVWDNMSSRTSHQTTKTLKAMHLDAAVIPEGCSNYIQAPHVQWKAAFDARVRQFYLNWVCHGGKPFTEEGTSADPPLATVLQWIADSWREIPEDVIERSFANCGVMIVLNAPGDQETRDLSPGNQVSAAVGRLSGATSAREESVDRLEEEESDEVVFSEQGRAQEDTESREGEGYSGSQQSEVASLTVKEKD